MGYPVKRIVVTGANGSGKTYLARCLSNLMPAARLVSFDAIKLTENWKQKSKVDIYGALEATVTEDCWILEGGPSLLEKALDRADLVVWLDPPFWRRAMRLLIRPWKYLGQTRPELPDGNIDWPIQQYRFAVQSLRRSNAFHKKIAAELGGFPSEKIIVCRYASDLERVMNRVGGSN
ncbi:DNA topology modulation protein FlaR [Aliiroseovarius sp. S253]|uniref:DNA topology modulation protein FlaR n=1 Tax=Aliiroseovarius sp. S253 TaxID=3415133 RepID=UPI003C7E12E8